MSPSSRPPGITAISLFFLFGVIMSGLSAVMLFFPGTRLDSLWRLNPRAQAGFASLGDCAPALMSIVCAACLVASVGLWRCRRWGLWAAISTLCINLIGDTASAVIDHDPRTLIGIPIGGMMLAYLFARRRVFS